jgi:hypothetical protein
VQATLWRFPLYGRDTEVPMNTRRTILISLPALARRATAQPKLGDEEWMRNYRDFVKASNEFVIAINDGIVDRKKWQRLRATWHEIDIG